MGFRVLAGLACTVVLLGGAPGCGIILGYGGLQPVSVTSTPEGASLIVDGVPQEGEVTPCTLNLHPAKEHILRATLGDTSGPGYVKKQIRIPVAVMDGVFTLGIGLLIDYLSGSLYSLAPQAHINLGKAPEPMAPTPPPTAGTTTTGQETPCPICGEPRGDQTPCPHCGME